MRKGFLFFLFLIIIMGYIASVAFSKNTDEGLSYTNFSKKELLKDLAFSENQIFNKTYTSNSIEERLERLEIAVFGAIQSGEEEFRIRKLKKSVTNVSLGGNGLNSLSKIFNLAGNNSGISSWAIGNMHDSYSNSCVPRYQNFSHRLPRRKHYSHRLPPPPPYFNENYNNNPITNGNFSKNYSIGTSVKILDD